MIIGVPKEVKPDEYRVAILLAGVELLVADGHTILIEQAAGLGSGFHDQAYLTAGAKILNTPEQVYTGAELIVKVKEPQPQEISRLRAGQTVFCFFHFAGCRQLTTACLQAEITAVAYETLTDANGRLPLLTPMSEIAGRMAVQQGAKYLEKPMLGRGVLLGGVPGVKPANVLILGAGIVGSNAARMAAGLGANVTIMDIDLDRLRYLDEVMPANVTTLYCDPHAVEQAVIEADLVIGAVLIPGGKAPVLISRPLVARMKPGSVIVDVSIDQGGCIETAKPTTHHEPTFVIDGVVHYCVANMPGAVSITASQALCNATLPFVRELARLGLDAFAAADPGHAAAINMRNGKITNPAVSKTFPDLPARSL